MTTTPDHRLDGVLRDWIGCATLMVEHSTGRQALLVDGGRFSRLGRGWEYIPNGGKAMTVSVPSTLAALEARMAQLRPVAA